MPDPVWYLPAPHAVQLPADTDPSPVRYEPGGHGRHSHSAVAPDHCPYCPAKHSVQLL